MPEPLSPFARWLNVTMQQRGLSQAAVARALGVADAQVSRWRRGQVVPTVRYLQQIAQVFDVPRAALDELAGYPSAAPGPGPGSRDPARAAELQSYQARFGRLLDERVPPSLWPAYMEAADALAGALVKALGDSLAAAQAGDDAPENAGRNIGFRHRTE